MEYQLYKTYDDWLGRHVLWKVLEKMAYLHRVNRAQHDIPISVYNGFERIDGRFRWSISVYTMIEDFEGFFDLCDVLARRK
jgi:hypothetical protein